MVSILANLALKTPHALVPAGGGDLAGLTEPVALGRRDRQHQPRTTTSRTSAGRRSPTRAASTARPWPRSSGATSTSTRRAVGNDGRLVVSELGGRANTSIRAEQLGPRARRRRRPARAVEAHQAARGRRARLRGRRGELRAADPAPRGGLRRAVPDRRLHLPRRAARRARAAGRGDGQGRGRRRDAPHRGRRQRAGQRARRGAAQGAPGVLPGLDDVHLVDYKVRILDGGAATAARTRVIIDSTDGARTWSTMGSDTNIIAASASALADSLEYAIWKSGAELRRRDERHFTTAPAERPATPRPAARPRPHGGDPMTDADPADRTLQLARWTVDVGQQRPQPRRGRHRRRATTTGTRRPRATARSTRCTGRSTRPSPAS